tara:strand:+ start:784 stop:2730 length:1947 start_codon:yes stop_codon:yes gene_type:complete
MKNKLLLIILLSPVFAQLSGADIIRYQNEQLDAIKNELQESSITNNKLSQSIVTNSDDMLGEVVIEKQMDKVSDTVFFGYSYFERSINFYDNVPAPDDFKLGPGDEIILSMWGETNLRERFLINKDGLIYYKNIGLINLSNKTLKEAEIILKNELEKIFSTIGDTENPTNLMLELGQLKSLNVYFTGQVKNPGINLVHPFSDVFTALVQSGGVKKNGSLRNIKVLRKNKEIASIDFYEFFVNGKNNFSKIKLIDGDIIHIPSVKQRVEIRGEINNAGKYEILESESLNQLISFAGGLTALASDKVLLKEISSLANRKSDDMAKSSRIINISSKSKLSLNNGSLINILPLADNSTDVKVLGRVVRPGSYPAFDYFENNRDATTVKPISLKKVLDAAGGFNDSIFSKTIDKQIVILRLDEDKFYSKEFLVNYEDSNDFLLEVNDNILVYEKPNYENLFSYRIDGEINKPGVYPLVKGLTIQDALNLAGGLTEMGSINSISVTKNLEFLDSSGEATQNRELVGNISSSFEIGNKDEIFILPKSNVVKVGGNIYSPGFVAYGNNRMTMSKAIELAGGYKPYSLKKQAYVVRSNGEIEKAGLFRGRMKSVFPGDFVFVPVEDNPSDFDITTFFADISSTLANIAAILVIIDRN